jgi:hypothetical protein
VSDIGRTCRRPSSWTLVLRQWRAMKMTGNAHGADGPGFRRGQPRFFSGLVFEAIARSSDLLCQRRGRPVACGGVGGGG